jgi:hypothetical protein
MTNAASAPPSDPSQFTGNVDGTLVDEPPVIAAPDDQPEASFEEQLAGMADYLKHAALAALAAIAEGHPEQVLDLIGNLITSYEKIRTFEPILALQARFKAEAKERDDERTKQWKEGDALAWEIANRELDFMKRAKEAGFSEESCFALLERSFPPAPPKSEKAAEAPESPWLALAQKLAEIAGQVDVGKTGHGGCVGGGGFVDQAAVAHHHPEAKGVELCAPCQKRVKDAVAQFTEMHPGMVQRAGQPQPMNVGLGDLVGDSFGAAPSIDLLGGAAPMSMRAQNAFASGAFGPPLLSTVAQHYGVPGVSHAAAQVLAQHAAPYQHGPSLVERATAGVQALNAFEMLEDLLRRQVILPVEGGFVVEAEMAHALRNLTATHHSDVQTALAENH